MILVTIKFVKFQSLPKKIMKFIVLYLLNIIFNLKKNIIIWQIIIRPFFQKDRNTVNMFSIWPLKPYPYTRIHDPGVLNFTIFVEASKTQW